jgi:type VI secretion system secreted protein VgrG
MNATDPSGLSACGQPKPQRSCIPLAPPGVNVDENIKEALGKQIFAPNAPSPIWFRNAVRNGGKWDYKQRGSQYEDFGNFNYGATGAAAGFTRQTLLSEAGRAQVEAGTSRPGWGKPGSRYFGEGGIPPYGDDPKDQYWIQRGIEYFERRFLRGQKEDVCK